MADTEINPLHVLDDIEKGRVAYVDRYVMSSQKPVGFDTLAYEQGFTGAPQPHGVDFTTFQRQTKEDNKQDERYMEWSRIQKGESCHEDYAYPGFMRHDPTLVRHTGYDTPGAKTDASAGVPSQDMIRAIHSAYAQKRGFHESYNRTRVIEDEVEHQPPGLRVTKLAAEPDGVEPSGSFRRVEPIIAEVVEHGLDGILQHGWQVPDKERAEGLAAFRKHVGTDDTGFDHGGPFRAGAKRFAYHGTMRDGADDADFVPMGEPDHVPADSYSTANYQHDSTANQKHRLATQEGGFRSLTNRGATGMAIELEGRQFL